jgi:hypothetical protein
MTNASRNFPNHTAKLQRVNLVAWALVGASGFFSTNSYALDAPAPPAMEAARVVASDVVGDLGGVPVTIPRHFANYAEYEGDPNWGEKRQAPKPNRTYQSRLVSFGYYTRFPDMAGESSEKLISDRRAHSRTTTPWIRVGVITGNIYPGGVFLERMVASIGKSGDIIQYEQYEKLPGVQHGLTVYAARGTDPKTSRPYREDRNAHDLFVHRVNTGRADAYVDCSNRNVPEPPCQHSFSLEPHMRAQISVIYRRGQLANWREIQQAVTRKILGFKSSPSGATLTKPSP